MTTQKDKPTPRRGVAIREFPPDAILGMLATILSHAQDAGVHIELSNEPDVLCIRITGAQWINTPDGAQLIMQHSDSGGSEPHQQELQSNPNAEPQLA